MPRSREGKLEHSARAEISLAIFFSTAPSVLSQERLTFFHNFIKIVNRLSIKVDSAPAGKRARR